MKTILINKSRNKLISFMVRRPTEVPMGQAHHERVQQGSHELSQKDYYGRNTTTVRPEPAPQALPLVVEGHQHNLLKYLLLLGIIFSAYMFTLQPVMAHGEKALEPFIRMRTIQWYDVQWSKQKFNVNEEISVSGKFHVAEDWPASVPKPEAAFLNISTPGPVLIRTERYLNGKPYMNSVALQPGGDYDFKVVLKGRLPGHYHIHPFFNLKDTGQVMGPGVWLDIAGDAADFSNNIQTINGEMVNMETYGLGNGIFWHSFWAVLATAWLLWWVRRPLFIARYRMLQAGMENELITPSLKIKNGSDKPIQIGEFATGNVRFFNKDVPKSELGSSESVASSEGLSVDNAAPIQPGEQRTMTIAAKDALWESERLDGLINDADSRIGGLLFFYDGTGERYISSLTAAVIPKFN